MRAMHATWFPLVLAAIALSAGQEAFAQPTQVDFVASTRAHRSAARDYRTIWETYGPQILAALEARTCLRFPEIEVAAVIDDAVSHSGGPEHPMRLRATYAPSSKQSTLVHELGHRHLWQLTERLDDIDGHMTLYLVLDRVWADVWGEEFAADRVAGESSWQSEYDYASAWAWARSLAPEERLRLWNRLLLRNGFADGCPG
jgi:hypothetical protein